MFGGFGFGQGYFGQGPVGGVAPNEQAATADMIVLAAGDPDIVALADVGSIIAKYDKDYIRVRRDIGNSVIAQDDVDEVDG